MERETFLYLAERAARYASVQRRGQLVRATVATPGACRRPDGSGRRPAFFAGLAARAAGYGPCAET